jgi:hypothetical protein
MGKIVVEYFYCKEWVTKHPNQNMLTWESQSGEKRKQSLPIEVKHIGQVGHRGRTGGM